MLRLVNNRMELELLALIGNNALLKRLNDESFIVVNGLNIHNDFSCEWDYAYGYVQRYNDAFMLFNEKVLTPFKEYEDTIDVDVIDNTTEEDDTGVSYVPSWMK